MLVLSVLAVSSFRSPHPVPVGERFTIYALSSGIFRYLVIDRAIEEYSVSRSNGK